MIITKDDVATITYPDYDVNVVSFVCSVLGLQIDCKFDSLDEIDMLRDRAIDAFNAHVL